MKVKHNARTPIKPMQITFKKAEAEWRAYHLTLKQKALLRQSIISPYNEEPDENSGGHDVFAPSSPTENIATRLTTNKQLHYLEEVTSAIEQVYNALPADYQRLVRYRYWTERNYTTWDAVAAEVNISKRQAMRWRDEIILATIEVLGWR